MPAVLAAVVKEHLVANANTQQRLAAQGNLSYQVGQWAQGPYSVTESRYAGQNQARSIFDRLGITAKYRITAYVPKRVANAPDVSNIVIDDSYHNYSALFTVDCLLATI